MWTSKEEALNWDTAESRLVEAMPECHVFWLKQNMIWHILGYLPAKAQRSVGLSENTQSTFCLFNMKCHGPLKGRLVVGPKRNRHWHARDVIWPNPGFEFSVDDKNRDGDHLAKQLAMAG